MMSTRKVLGRGLEALIPVAPAAIERPQPGEKVFEVATDGIEANPFQPRKHIDDEKLKELSESIKSDGVLQPVVVRRKGQKYELIMGERRLQAARLAGVARIPVVVRDVSDADALRLAIVENIQRENLNPIEEAQAYRRLADELQMSQEAIATAVGKDRATVANAMRLLKLPDEIRGAISSGALSAGHARALLALETDSEQRRLAREIVARSLSVRETESLVRQQAEPSPAPPARPADPNTRAAEDRLKIALGTHTRIIRKGKGGRIEFRNEDELQRIYELLTGE
jgi:ParB family chromosome partitioning protein